MTVMILYACMLLNQNVMHIRRTATIQTRYTSIVCSLVVRVSIIQLRKNENAFDCKTICSKRELFKFISRLLFRSLLSSWVRTHILQICLRAVIFYKKA